jgi:hypothetical protein
VGHVPVSPDDFLDDGGFGEFAARFPSLAQRAYTGMRIHPSPQRKQGSMVCLRFVPVAVREEPFLF